MKESKKRKMGDLSPDKIRDGGSDVIMELWEIVKELQESAEKAKAEAMEMRTKVEELEKRLIEMTGAKAREQEEVKCICYGPSD